MSASDGHCEESSSRWPSSSCGLRDGHHAACASGTSYTVLDKHPARFVFLSPFGQDPLRCCPPRSPWVQSPLLFFVVDRPVMHVHNATKQAASFGAKNPFVCGPCRLAARHLPLAPRHTFHCAHSALPQAVGPNGFASSAGTSPRERLRAGHAARYRNRGDLNLPTHDLSERDGTIATRSS